MLLGGNVLETQAASISAPKITSVKAKNPESLTVSWKKVKGATGYQIYQTTSKKGKYKKIATISKGSTTSYVVKKLKADKVYYYKIRSYKKVKGKNAYSFFSKVKNAQPYPKAVIVSPNSKPYKNNYTKHKNYNAQTKSYYMLMSYMECFSKTKGGTIILKKGTYNIPSTIYVPSNVKIILSDGVVLNKTNDVGSSSLTPSTKLFVFVDGALKNKKNATSKYAGTKKSSVTAQGKATININSKQATAFALAHNDNINISGLTINLKASGTKAFSISGSSKVSVSKCVIQGTKSDVRGILIDLPAKGTTQTYEWAKSDNTVCKNIKIQQCKFNKLQNAVYSNRFIKDKYHSGIILSKNEYTNIFEDAIRVMNWKAPKIENSKFVNNGGGANSTKEDVFVSIRVYGAQNPVISGNTFDNCERAVYLGYKKNSDRKLENQGETVNSISVAEINQMVKANTVNKMRDYYISNSKKGSSEVEKYWMADENRDYVMYPDQTPYRNQFRYASDYNGTTRQYYVFRSYMEQMERNGGGTLTVKAGTYKLSGKVYIPSNVTINLENGVNIKCSFSNKLEGPLFSMVERKVLDAEGTYSGYNGVHDVKIIGPESGTATIDKNYVAGSTITIGHAKNIVVSNIQFQNMNGSNGHFMEIDASKNVTVSGNTFKNYKYDGKPAGKEAINIDLPDKNTGGFNAVYTSYDCTPNDTLVIQNNIFDNLPVAVGSHMYTPGKQHKNIKILNNKIRKCDFYAIRMDNWSHPVVTGNEISGIGNGNEGFAMVLRGVATPSISTNTVTGAEYFMNITTAYYSENNVNKNNPNYKKLLNYREVVNDFGPSDFARLGFNDNNNTKQIKYKNSKNNSYSYCDMPYVE